MMVQANKLDPSSEGDMQDGQAAGAGDKDTGNDLRGQQLASLLLRVGTPAVRAHPKIVQLLAHVLPFLTYGVFSYSSALFRVYVYT